MGCDLRQYRQRATLKTKQPHSSMLRSPVSSELGGVVTLREEVEADNSRLDGVTSVTDLSWAQERRDQGARLCEVSGTTKR